MKKKIKGIIVVEGKSDVSFLSSFIESEFVITNGSDVPQKTIDYLLKQSTHKKIIVLVDPDYQGNKIRKTLNDKISKLNHCYVEQSNATKNNKVGIAESSKETILEALKTHFTKNELSRNNFTMKSLFELGLYGQKNSSILRNKVAKQLSLGYVNGKQFLNRLNSLNLQIKQIKETL